MKPLVSLITVNYRQPLVTIELLKSLQGINFDSLEVILIDNDPLEHVDFESAFKGIRVIRTETNLGFAGANNLGMSLASGSYLFLVNNDTELNPNLIHQLLGCFADPKVGAVCPVIRYYHYPEKIQYSGFTPIHPLTGRNKLLQNIPKYVEETPYFHGAAVMISTAAMKAVGPMEESFFLYYEELDWSIRFRNEGFKILVCPTAVIDHKESVSTGKNSPFKLYYQTRNRVHFMRRNSDSFWSFLIFFCLVSFPKKWISLFLKRENDHRRALVRGIWDGVLKPKYGPQNLAA